MAKILVLADSHKGFGLMRLAMQTLRPDAVIHLGDFYEDGQVIAQENPHVPIHQVPGNCDTYYVPASVSRLLCYSVCGVKLFMTHGHDYGVHGSPIRLLMQAREFGAKAALYGHTHNAVCHQEADGVWLLNPGTCRSLEGSVGLIEVENGEISACRILRQEDMT